MKSLASPTVLFLCLAVLAFPFSVAGANIALGITLGLGILSGLWWQGARHCWEHYRLLSIAFCAYFALMLLGLLWSLDKTWGLHVIGRSWFWLLVPVTADIATDEKWKKLFLLSLSAGLAVNLVYCLFQMLGYVNPMADGSSASDATGHIGHIGFGLVYGVWAAWLLHLGLCWNDRRRWVVWSLAIWSYAMIFSAQGRSGYLIAVVLMLSVYVKWLLSSKDWRIVPSVVAMLFLMSLVIALGPGKERLQGTWLSFTQTEQGKQVDNTDEALPATQQRFYMWKTSLDIYRENPVFGVGTGGLPAAVSKLKAEGRLTSQFAFIFTHPHNQYILVLARWGPLGLLSLSAVFFFWMREGWTLDWREPSMAPLIFLPSLGLAIHALSSSSLEEHFPAILATLLLGAGLSIRRE